MLVFVEYCLNFDEQVWAKKTMPVLSCVKHTTLLVQVYLIHVHVSVQELVTDIRVHVAEQHMCMILQLLTQ